MKLKQIHSARMMLGAVVLLYLQFLLIPAAHAGCIDDQQSCVDKKCRGPAMVSSKIPGGTLGAYTNNSTMLAQAQREKAETARCMEQCNAAQRTCQGHEQQAKLKEKSFLGKVFKDCGDCPEMVIIPAGSFDMGSNDPNGSNDLNQKPAHRVNVPLFALARTEVTQRQWLAIMGSNPSKFIYCGDDCPVDSVSWEDAQAYIKKLNEKTGHNYRLPSEAEWEYAARASTTTKYWWGDVASHEYMNYGKDECCSGPASGRDRWENTAPVAQFPANAFGLYDMHGNVREWTEDCWHDNYRGAPVDGGNWTAGGDCGRRVLRGGSWSSGPQLSRTADRVGGSIAIRLNYIGFRPASTPPLDQIAKAKDVADTHDVPNSPPQNTLAETSKKITGTWVVDIAATERSILKMAPRANAVEIARNFLVMGGYLAIIMFVIEDDFATYAVYGDANGKGAKFKLVSQNQTERKYIATDKDLSKGTITITALSDEYIRIIQQNDPLGYYVLWKRATPQPIRTSEALDAQLSTWRVSIERISKHLLAQDIHQTEAVPPKRWSEDATLHDGRRIKVEREVSYTFEHSMGDAGSGFSVFKNKLSNHSIRFKHPDTGKFIDWQGNPSFTPVLLDVIDGNPYLVLSARPTKETERVYGCTELPFIYLQYDTISQGKWRTVPEDRAPRALKRVNLSFAEEAKLKNYLSVDEVQETIAQKEKSSDRFIQREIPRDYSEWRYLYKNSYRNERRRDDCRPPRAPLPQMALPAPIEGSPEILETIDYTPDRIAIGDAWSDLVFDRKREGECKNLFRPTDPDDYMQGQRFVRDSSGKKPVPYSWTVQFNMGVRVLCDDDVWFVTHQEEPEKIVISKFTVTGDLVFRTSFRKPDRVEGFVGYIRIPSLRSEGGYLYFDWLDFRDVNREWHIKRRLKMRMKEPN